MGAYFHARERTDAELTDALRRLTESAEAAADGDPADYTITVPSGGTIALVESATGARRDDLRANVGDDAIWLGDVLTVDLAMLGDFVTALQLDGHTVATPTTWEA